MTGACALATQIEWKKLPAGMHINSWRDELGQLHFDLGEHLNRYGSKTMVALCYSAWKRHGWDARGKHQAGQQAGAAVPVAAALAWPARHGVAKIAAMTAATAVTAGMSAAVLLGPAAQSPFPPAGRSPGSGGGPQRVMPAVFSGRRTGRHRKPSPGTPQVSSANPVPAGTPAHPSPAPLVSVSVSPSASAQVMLSAGTQPVQVQAGKHALVTVPPANADALIPPVPLPVQLPQAGVCADAGLLRACAGG